MAVIVIALLMSAGSVEACSCPWVEETPTAARHRVAAVFEGMVVDQRAVFANVYALPILFDAAIEYELRPVRVWKGSLDPNVHLLRASPCEGVLTVGKQYLIYAPDDGASRLFVGGCTPTKPIDEAEADIIELGAPLEVFQQTPIRVSPSMPFHRRLRAYLVVGSAAYASLTLSWPDALHPVAVLWLGAIAIELIPGLGWAFWQRPRHGKYLLAAVVPTALAAIFWAGEQALQNEWFSPFLTW